MSQVELAHRLGTRQQFVSKYESCERRLDIVEFIDIARELTLDWSVELDTIPARDRARDS